MKCTEEGECKINEIKIKVKGYFFKNPQKKRRKIV